LSWWLFEIFPKFDQKCPKKWTFWVKSGGLFEFCISGGLIKSGGLMARISRQHLNSNLFS